MPITFFEHPLSKNVFLGDAQLRQNIVIRVHAVSTLFYFTRGPTKSNPFFQKNVLLVFACLCYRLQTDFHQLKLCFKNPRKSLFHMSPV